VQFALGGVGLGAVVVCPILRQLPLGVQTGLDALGKLNLLLGV